VALEGVKVLKCHFAKFKVLRWHGTNFPFKIWVQIVYDNPISWPYNNQMLYIVTSIHPLNALRYLFTTLITTIKNNYYGRFEINSDRWLWALSLYIVAVLRCVSVVTGESADAKLEVH
jgi:hypothetical protein